jgi:hypothetical protein
MDERIETPVTHVEHLPADPSLDRPRHAEGLEDDAAAERIHEFLRGYEDGDLLGGWVIFHEWIDADGNHSVASTIAPGLDWARVLGIVAAGQMRMTREFLSEPED